MIDRSGDKYGLATVINISHKSKSLKYIYNCKCDCGKEFKAEISNLRNGHTKSCGCLKSLNKASITHHLTKTPEYRTWSDIKTRCYNSKTSKYKYYGGKGITMSNEWKNSFLQFFEDMGEKPSKNHSIERDDVDGNYCKENCRWILMSEQGKNKTNSIKITYNGVTENPEYWESITGLPKSLIINRYGKKWSIQDILETSIGKIRNSKMTDYATVKKHNLL